MIEELGVEEEAIFSSWAFVLHSRSGSLNGLLAKDFLRGIFGFGKILPRGLLGFYDFWKDFREFLKGTKGRGVLKIDLGEKCRHEAWS